MVKAVVGEEAQLQLAEARLFRSGDPSEVGLVIGKLSSALDRGFVFDLIPTPPNDAREPASSLIDEKKKGSKSKPQADSSSLLIDQDWVAEHARQVSRMLVGGIKVVGVYIWATDASFKNSTSALCQTTKAVAEATPILGSGFDERLIIHISYSPKRWTCRSCVPASNITSSSLRPCDFKMGKVLPSLQSFKCTYEFDLRVPILNERNLHCKTFADFLRSEIMAHANGLTGAMTVIDGNLVVKDDTCASDGLHEVELLLPVGRSSVNGACSQKEVIGVLAFKGSVYSLAYASSKELISQAIADIKEDIIRSLQTRLDIFCDMADECKIPDSIEMSTQNSIRQLLPSLRKPCMFSLPRRVFVPWLAGKYICDYLQPSESLEVLKEHCAELMSFEVPAAVSEVMQPETDAPSLAVKAFWDAAVPASKSHSRGQLYTERGGRGKSKEFLKLADFSTIVAVIILLFSALVAWLLVF